MRVFFRRDAFTLSVLTAILIVSLEVEPWALILSIALIFCRFAVEKNWCNCPNKFWINTFAVTALGLVLFQFRTFTGQEPSSTFLVLLASIRILDFRKERDEKLLIFMGFVLISLKFLYSIDLYWFPIGAAIYLGLWKSLLPSYHKQAWLQTFVSLTKSIPIVALLFFAFPRVQVPWARQWQPPIALSGFSESVSPGEIANLTMSKETVMRVEFLDFVPNLNSLYWRGAVLEKTDGFGWSKAPVTPATSPTPQAMMAHDYIVTLEPSYNRSLPVLEHTRMIVTPSLRATKSDRSIFNSDHIISSRVRYYGYSTENWSGPTVNDPLELPPLPSKTKAWLKEKNSKKLSFQDKLKVLRDFFSNNNFVYTRQPGEHKNLDEFLFERRMGFCEHYAGAYAVLARGLGLPARVITGYQGGEKNQLASFVQVTQADAHAWVEVQEPSGRWRRIDPTYWIAPLRIELGAESFFQLTPDDLRLSTYEALSKLKNKSKITNLINTVQTQIETLNFIWVRMFLEFDLSEQQKLIQFFAPQMGWWITILILAILGMRLIRKWFESRKHRPLIVVQNYLWIEKQIASQLKIKRDPAIPPIQFLQKIGQLNPELSSLAEKTIQMYRQERYRKRHSSPEDWRRILRGWKEKVAKPQA